MSDSESSPSSREMSPISISPTPSSSGSDKVLGKRKEPICTLCTHGLGALCLSCKVSATPADIPRCDVTKGRCQHSYHFHCLARHLRTKMNCPGGDHEWEFRRAGDP